MIWGLYFFVLLLAEKLWLGKLLDKLPRTLQHVYTIFLVLVSWAIFALEDFAQMRGYLSVMFGLSGAALADGAFGYYLTSYLPILCAAARGLHQPGQGRLRQAAPPGGPGGVRCPGGRRTDRVQRLSGGWHLQPLPVFPLLKEDRT